MCVLLPLPPPTHTQRESGIPNEFSDSSDDDDRVDEDLSEGEASGELDQSAPSSDNEEPDSEEDDRRKETCAHQ